MLTPLIPAFIHHGKDKKKNMIEIELSNGAKLTVEADEVWFTDKWIVIYRNGKVIIEIEPGLFKCVRKGGER